MDTLVEYVKAHALDNYEAGGWDVIVECFTDSEIRDRLTEQGATNKTQALEAFAFMVDVWADRQAEAAQYRDEY